MARTPQKDDHANVFLVMPRANYSEYAQLRQIVEAWAIEKNLRLRSPDYSALHPSFDLEETIGAMSEADLILVDLSHERPSCYFELGIAETLGLPINVIAKSGTPIHQTSYRDRVVFYANLSDLERRLRLIEIRRRAANQEAAG